MQTVAVADNTTSAFSTVQYRQTHSLHSLAKSSLYSIYVYSYNNPIRRVIRNKSSPSSDRQASTDRLGIRYQSGRNAAPSTAIGSVLNALPAVALSPKRRLTAAIAVAAG